MRENIFNLNYELREVLREAAEMYANLENALDTSKLEMPVTSEHADTLLFTYMMLYGKQENRHGGFNTAENYRKFMQRANRLKGLPEVDGLVTRIKTALVNLAKRIEALPAQDISRCGYTLGRYEGRLLVCSNKVDS